MISENDIAAALALLGAWATQQIQAENLESTKQISNAKK